MPIVKLYATKDATISNHSWDTGYMYQDGASQGLHMGSWDWGSSTPYYAYYAYQGRMLMQFEVPQLPIGSTLMSAKLKMYLMKQESMTNPYNAWYYTYNQNPTVEIGKLLQSWDEGTGSGHDPGAQNAGVTWSYRGPRHGYWSIEGGYYNTTGISKTEPWQDHWWEFDVKSIVEGWMTDPATNHGFLVKYGADYNPQGMLSTWSKETGYDSRPYLEIVYNSAPEKPRGLSPNFGSFVCLDLSHTTHFKWNFIDIAMPPAKGKGDIVFLVDVSGSMHWRLGHVKRQIESYIDRLQTEGVDYRVGLVAFSDTRIGEPIRKWGWFTTKEEILRAYDVMPRLNGGDWPETGLEAIMDTTNGAMSFPFRSDAKVQFMLSTDAPFHNRNGVDTYYSGASIYEINEVGNFLKDRGIPLSIATNTHCSAYTQLSTLTRLTGGQYLEETAGWGTYLKILTIKTADESAAYDEGDYQSKADLRIFKIQPSGAHDLVWSYTYVGSQGELMVKGLGVPWEEGASYEWDVVVYDQHGLASVPSDRAQFTYIIDVNAAVGIPMFNEPILVNQTINRKVWNEIRDKLYYEVRKYSNMNAEEALTLFNGEVVPSRDDMRKLKNIMDRMLINDGMQPLKQDLIDNTLGVSDVEYIRGKLVEVSYSPPDNPPGGTAVKTPSRMHRPGSISSFNTSSVDTTLDVAWSPAEVVGAGWKVRLQPCQDTDINYYKFYHEEVINYGNRPTRMLTETYINAEQIHQGEIIVPSTGRTDWERMWYYAHDMNGRVSWEPGQVNLDYLSGPGSVPQNVSYYVVEYQQRHWFASQSDPSGAWYQVYVGGGTSFTHTVSAEGSYWYRVKAVDTNGVSTDWTYSIDTTYIKY